jgi:hypothetical protein
MNWIHVAQNRDQWRIFINSLNNLFNCKILNYICVPWIYSLVSRAAYVGNG